MNMSCHLHPGQSKVQDHVQGQIKQEARLPTDQQCNVFRDQVHLFIKQVSNRTDLSSSAYLPLPRKKAPSFVFCTASSTNCGPVEHAKVLSRAFGPGVR